MFKTSRKWFVLYDDNLKPLQGGRGSDASSTAEPASSFSEAVVAHIPAHLEYHDSEKKWREGKAPNRDIVLQDCFNIYRKKDKEGLNGHIISLCTLKDSLDIVFENDRDLSIWMELLLCCQQGGRSSTGKLKRSIYENMWEVGTFTRTPFQWRIIILKAEHASSTNTRPLLMMIPNRMLVERLKQRIKSYQLII